MKKNLLIIALIVVIVVSFAISGYILFVNKDKSFAGRSNQTISAPLTDEQKIETLRSLNEASTAPRLTNEERLKILKSLHTK